MNTNDNTGTAFYDLLPVLPRLWVSRCSDFSALRDFLAEHYGSRFLLWDVCTIEDPKVQAEKELDNERCRQEAEARRFKDEEEEKNRSANVFSNLNCLSPSQDTSGKSTTSVKRSSSLSNVTQVLRLETGSFAKPQYVTGQQPKSEWKRIRPEPSQRLPLSPPTLDQIFRAVYAFACWLRLRKDNVVVLRVPHTKIKAIDEDENDDEIEDPEENAWATSTDLSAGLIVACFLVWSKAEDNFLDALERFYGGQNSQWIPPSSRRALIHFHSLVHIEALPRLPVPVRLNCCVIHGLPPRVKRGKKSGTRAWSKLRRKKSTNHSKSWPRLEIVVPTKYTDHSQGWTAKRSRMTPVFSTAWSPENVMSWDPEMGHLVVALDTVVCGDMTVIVYEDDESDAPLCFFFSTHSLFLTPGVIQLYYSKLDATAEFLASAAKTNLRLELVVAPPKEEDAGLAEAYAAIDARLDHVEAFQQGLHEIAAQHMQPLDSAALNELHDWGFDDATTALALQLSGNDIQCAEKLLQEGGLDCPYAPRSMCSKDEINLDCFDIRLGLLKPFEENASSSSIDRKKEEHVNESDADTGGGGRRRGSSSLDAVRNLDLSQFNGLLEGFQPKGLGFTPPSSPRSVSKKNNASNPPPLPHPRPSRDAIANAKELAQKELILSDWSDDIDWGDESPTSRIKRLLDDGDNDDGDVTKDAEEKKSTLKKTGKNKRSSFAWQNTGVGHSSMLHVYTIEDDGTLDFDDVNHMPLEHRLGPSSASFTSRVGGQIAFDVDEDYFDLGANMKLTSVDALAGIFDDYNKEVPISRNRNESKLKVGIVDDNPKTQEARDRKKWRGNLQNVIAELKHENPVTGTTGTLREDVSPTRLYHNGVTREFKNAKSQLNDIQQQLKRMQNMIEKRQVEGGGK
eukprot:g2929.t1